MYDRYGTADATQGFGGFQSVDMSDIFGGMSDIFSSFFGGMGGGRSRQQRRDGRDMGIGLRLTLEEVACGAKKEIVYDRLAPCDECGGSGAAEGGQQVDCKTCGGSGRVVSVQRTFLGDMQTASTCPECNGKRGEDIIISTGDSKVKVMVIPTNEELVIARDTKALVEG